MKQLLSLTLLYFIVICPANAQFFQTGQDPSQIRWRQINTDHFQIIYPEEFDKEAQRLSFVFSKVYEYGSNTLNFKPRKVSVVLHTRTVNSNGLVAWAPKRIELFTTPHQQIYAQDWLEELALHEFRHLVQMDKIQSELPFLLKFILGEQAAAIVTGVFLPFWFLEGDAVVTETALSKTGRGRMASFSMEYRAQLIDKRKYSFDKAFLGSYKDFVPDHYKLGYWMVGKSREKYGAQIWSDVLDKVGNHPLSITPVNSILKKETGLNSHQLYNQIFDNLTVNWKQEQKTHSLISSLVVSPSRKSYTDYLYPEFYKDSFIVAYRTSIDDISRFVMISPDKTEKIIYTPGTIFEESVSMKDQFIIWAEKRADIRWTHAERSVVMVYNIETKMKQEIVSENKLFSPVISPELKSFAAVEVDPENDVFLSVFDINSGKLLHRIKPNDNSYLFTPCWDEKGEKLYFVCLSSKGKYLASVDLSSKHIQPITLTTFGNIKNPVFTRHQLVFSADFSGKDLLYSLDTESHQIFMIYNSSFGADYPSAINSKNQILFSNYSASGYQLSIIILNEKNNLSEVSDISLKSNQLADNISAQEKGIPDFSKVDSIRYRSKKYSKLGHLFNFHSWAPAYIDVNSYEIRPGVSVFSQNKLGTAQTQIGYDYNVGNRTGKYYLAFNYSGLFPEINPSITYGNEASNYYQITNTYNRFNQIISRDTSIQRFTWKELDTDLDVRLPLNLSKGKYSSMFIPEIRYSLNHTFSNAITKKLSFSADFQTLTYRLFYYHLLHQSNQNLMPKWGQQLDLLYANSPFNNHDNGSLTGVQAVLYFPGLVKNDGIKIYQGYQEKNPSDHHSFSNFVHFPRGFQTYENNKMYSIATDYKIPLAYPDMNLGKLIYVKRIKSTLFYDYAWLSVPLMDKNSNVVSNHSLRMNSYGLELTSDLHILRFFAPIDMGVRTIYLPDSGTFRFDYLLSVDFNGF